jgi:hypothetical protein
MDIETLGARRLRSAGASWRGASGDARMALARGQAGSAPIAGSWTWKRLCARAAGRFHCRVSKADNDARDVATGE